MEKVIYINSKWFICLHNFILISMHHFVQRYFKYFNLEKRKLSCMDHRHPRFIQREASIQHQLPVISTSAINRITLSAVSAYHYQESERPNEIRGHAYTHISIGKLTTFHGRCQRAEAGVSGSTEYHDSLHLAHNNALT